MGTPNLLTLLQVGDGALEALLNAAEHFRGHADAADVQGWVQHLGAAAQLADQRILAHLNPVELNVRHVARIGHAQPGDGHASRLAAHQKQADAIALRGAAGRARHHQQLLGHVAIEHKGLAPVDDETAGGGFRRGGHGVGTMAVGFLQRQGHEQFACGDARQHFRLFAHRCRRR